MTHSYSKHQLLKRLRLLNGYSSQWNNAGRNSAASNSLPREDSALTGDTDQMTIQKESLNSQTANHSPPATHTCSECETPAEHVMCDDCLEELLEKYYHDGFRDGQAHSVSD